MGQKKAISFDVDELLKNLKLSEAEQDGVVLAKADRAKLPEVKWMAAARLLTTKHFSEQSLIQTMCAAWNTTREVSFRAIGKNLFVVQAFCLGDWKRIMEEGPWIFRGCALMLEVFDGATQIPSVIPSKMQAWIQIHKIPPLYRTESIICQLAGKVGEVISADTRVNSCSDGEFHRARVNLVASKPLVRFVTLAPEGYDKIFLQVKYEKLPRFCAHCGLMGHIHLECGTGDQEQETLQFGEWMIAPVNTWETGTPRIRSFTPKQEKTRGGGVGVGNQGGRMGGQEAGRERTWRRGFHGARVGVWREKEKSSNGNNAHKHPSREADLNNGGGDDVSETASSSIKPTPEVRDKQEDVVDGGRGIMWKALDDTAPSLVKIAEKAGMEQETHSDARKQLVMDADVQTPPPPPKYISPREIKHAKRSEKKIATSVKDISEAGSLEERRHPK